MNKLLTITLLLFILLPEKVEGGIYICTDTKGVRSYSDKKCAINQKLKSEVISNLGRTNIPNSISEFTSIIEIVKRTLTIINEQIPDSDLYQRALLYSKDAELTHNNYMSTTHKVYPDDYNPFDPVKLVDIIAVISQGCRERAYMTICAAIEGNYWLHGEEQIYLKKQLDKGLKLKLTIVNKQLFCSKARFANQGGVVSHKIVDYFCVGIKE